MSVFSSPSAVSGAHAGLNAVSSLVKESRDTYTSLVLIIAELGDDFFKSFPVNQDRLLRKILATKGDFPAGFSFSAEEKKTLDDIKSSFGKHFCVYKLQKERDAILWPAELVILSGNCHWEAPKSRVYAIRNVEPHDLKKVVKDRLTARIEAMASPVLWGCLDFNTCENAKRTVYYNFRNDNVITIEDSYNATIAQLKNLFQLTSP